VWSDVLQQAQWESDGGLGCRVAAGLAVVGEDDASIANWNSDTY
jgi:hypothetical protein